MIRFSRSFSVEELLEKSSVLSNASIEIETDKTTYLAGETVSAKVKIKFLKACSVEEGSIALNWCWGYEFTMNQQTHYSESAEALVESRILTDRNFQAGESVLEQFSAEIPVNSQPTGQGSSVQVRWEVYVRLKVRGIDGRQAREIQVLSSTIDCSGPHPQSNKLPGEDYSLQIDIDQPWVRPGDWVTGVVTVLPHSDLKARKVTARLEYREKISTGGSWSWRYPDVIEVVLDDSPGTLPAGNPRSYPFRLQVPGDGCPSLETMHFYCRWVLEAKLDRRLKRDPKVELPVQVRTTPRGPISEPNEGRGIGD